MKKVVTEVEIYRIKPNKGLIAFASIVLFKQFYVSSIAIHTKIDGTGYRITYPTKNGIQVFHPLNKEISLEIENSIIKSFINLTNNND